MPTWLKVKKFGAETVRLLRRDSRGSPGRGMLSIYQGEYFLKADYNILC